MNIRKFWTELSDVGMMDPRSIIELVFNEFGWKIINLLRLKEGWVLENQ